MEHVFSQQNPILAINEGRDQSDRDEQRGFMLLFQGTVYAFRNPRAHKLLQDAPERAVEAIAMISFLTQEVERARVRT
jgi:uncharacterized protein (TIGR02391 family)